MGLRCDDERGADAAWGELPIGKGEGLIESHGLPAGVILKHDAEAIGAPPGIATEPRIMLEGLDECSITEQAIS
jgi:hypothetical protein